MWRVRAHLRYYDINLICIPSSSLEGHLKQLHFGISWKAGRCHLGIWHWVLSSWTTIHTFLWVSLIEHNETYFCLYMVKLWHHNNVTSCLMSFWPWHHFQIDDITSWVVPESLSQKGSQAVMLKYHCFKVLMPHEEPKLNWKTCNVLIKYSNKKCVLCLCFCVHGYDARVTKVVTWEKVFSSSSVWKK